MDNPNTSTSSAAATSASSPVSVTVSCPSGALATAAPFSSGSGGSGGSGGSSRDAVDGASMFPQASPVQECGCVRLGKCKWFNVAKGWGFLTPNDGGQEVFVHQSVIQMSGFRSLGEQEEVEFECQRTARGLEATRVSGRQGDDCHGSTYRPRMNKKTRRMRCYNCGEFANHIASECALGPQPKRCHRCRSEDHLHADCPQRNLTRTSSKSAAANSPTASVEGAAGGDDGRES